MTSPAPALSPDDARTAAARGDVLVRVDLPSGACWCRVVAFQPARGKRHAQLVVDAAGVALTVALERVRAVLW